MIRTRTSVLPKIVLIIIFQLLLLLAIIANRQLLLSSDNIVILETRPVDPRSLFRGDYVRLNYEINNLHLVELSGERNFKTNDTVYVVLSKEGQYWEAQAIYRDKPGLMSGQAMIRGVVKRVTSRHWNSAQKNDSEITTLRVSYGIENYFIPESEGLNRQRPETGDKISLEIALDDTGHAAIKTLLVNGVPRYEESLF